MLFCVSQWICICKEMYSQILNIKAIIINLNKIYQLLVAKLKEGKQFFFTEDVIK